MFDYLVAALAHGSGYERLTGPGCSDRTIRRRLRQWAAAGLTKQLHALTLQPYDQVIGLQLGDVAVDGCITKAPGGGEVAGRSPVDRGKQARKRSIATEGAGIPLGLIAAGANRHDSPLLAPTLHAAVARWAPCPTRSPSILIMATRAGPPGCCWRRSAFAGEIARKGVPAPVQAGKRWVVERTHSWMNGYGKLRLCTQRDPRVVDFHLYLAAAFVVVRRLIRQARVRYRWDTPPTTKRLK
jgi:hypothetical protein